MFTLLTVVVLSGGLGLSIFTFSFLHTAMLKPLPLSEGDRIVRIEQATPGTSSAFDVVDLAVMRPAIKTLSIVGAFTNRDVVVGDDGHRRVLHATAAESNMFTITRTRPVLGRVLRVEDEAVGAEPVMVLSAWAWRVVFGVDSTILNRRVLLNGTFTRVVGVMPEGYGFPVASDAWLPLGKDVMAAITPGAHVVDLYGRLATGIDARHAAAELRQLLDRAKKVRPIAGASASRVDVTVRSFPMSQIGDEGPLALTILNLLATLILLLACINVTSLLLARANERARETAVRMALGASRARLVMQSMWENVALCVLGGVLATAIAAWGLSAINAWMQNNLQRNLAFWWVWRLDRTALVSAGVFVTATIAVLGGVVSARVANIEFNTVLRDGGTRSGSRREGRIARALVITQVTTVSVLMFFGVMSAIVAYRVANVDIAYNTRNMLTASVALPRDAYDTREKRGLLYQSIADGLQRASAVDRAVLRAPVADLSDPAGAFDLNVANRTVSDASSRAYVQALLGPMSILGLTIGSGRFFDARDDDRAAPVAIVSQSLARKYWPGLSPIGQRIRLAADSGTADSRTVVGVVSDVLMGTPFSRNRSALAIYVPLRQTNAASTAIVFKHRGDVAAAQAALYQTLATADPKILPPDVMSFAEVLEKTTLIANSVTKLFALCFGFALLLAVSGTYGLMARSIGQRTREIGIRRALGATDGSVATLLLGQGSRQLGVGVLIALPAMVAIGIGFWKFFPIGLGVSTMAALFVSGTIVSVVLLATYLPTRRVLAVSPRDAIWTE